MVWQSEARFRADAPRIADSADVLEANKAVRAAESKRFGERSA